TGRHIHDPQPRMDADSGSPEVLEVALLVFDAGQAADAMLTDGVVPTQQIRGEEGVAMRRGVVQATAVRTACWCPHVVVRLRAIILELRAIRAGDGEPVGKIVCKLEIAAE